MSTAVYESKTNKENSSANNKSMMKSSTMDGGDRKTLKTLQLSANGTLIGSEKHPGKGKITASKKPLKIFQDKKSPDLGRLTCEVETQTIVNHQETEVQTDVTGATGVQTVTDSHNDSGAADLDQEAYDLMVRDPIPESYWRELAEERRLSLAEALSENEILHQSMEELKEENQNLSLLAGQAEHLASVLNDVLGDDEDDKTTDENKETELVEEVSEADKDEESSDTDQQETAGNSADTGKQEENTSKTT